MRDSPRSPINTWIKPFVEGNRITNPHPRIPKVNKQTNNKPKQTSHIHRFLAFTNNQSFTLSVLSLKLSAADGVVKRFQIFLRIMHCFVVVVLAVVLPRRHLRPLSTA